MIFVLLRSLLRPTTRLHVLACLFSQAKHAAANMLTSAAQRSQVDWKANLCVSGGPIRAQ